MDVRFLIQSGHERLKIAAIGRVTNSGSHDEGQEVSMGWWNF
jgi:hypothetical protein